MQQIPKPLAAHGLRAVHPRPLVGRRTADGFHSQRTAAAAAWQWPCVQIERAGSAYACVTVDVDRRAALSTIPDLPPANWIVRTPAGAHVTWTLAEPVHAYPEARAAPLEYFRDVSEFLQSELEGDPGYAHVLTRNPIFEHADAIWMRKPPYMLAELAGAIPAGWKRPRVALSGVGRNVDTFKAAMQWAGERKNASDPVLPVVLLMNAALEFPLPESECRSIARSVERYRERWQAQGWHSPGFRRRQAARGRKGGRPRLYEPGAEPWTLAGISRAKWYRTRARGT